MDTSALWAFFHREDEHHPAARKALQDPTPLLIPSEVLAEFFRLATKRAGPAAAKAAGEFLWSQENTEIQPSDAAVLMAAWGEYTENRRLTFEDCIVVAWCRERGAEPLSYDKALLRAVRA